MTNEHKARFLQTIPLRSVSDKQYCLALKDFRAVVTEPVRVVRVKFYAEVEYND